MRLSVGLLVVFAMFAAPAAWADDTDAAETPVIAALDDAAFDAQFQCPETLADRDARIAEILGYEAWAKDHHPDWSFRKRLDVRYGLLRRHGCALTLANVAASTRPPFAP